MVMIYSNMGVSPIPEDRHQSKIKTISIVYFQNGLQGLFSFTPIFTGCKSARTGYLYLDDIKLKIKIFLLFICRRVENHCGAHSAIYNILRN